MHFFLPVIIIAANPITIDEDRQEFGVWHLKGVSEYRLQSEVLLTGKEPN
jgi:hypothetical protein